MMLEAYRWMRCDVRAGRPSSGEQVVTLRLDPDLLKKFRETGKGWQSRIN